MAWRAINDTVGHSESLAAVSDLAERIYWRLLAHSDAYGRIPASPSKTRAMCFPLLNVSSQDVGEALSELEQVKRILAYEVDGLAAIQLTAFEENQPKEFIRRRGASRLPECPTLKSGSTPDYIRSLYKLPAKSSQSRTTPEEGGSSPATREEKRRERTKPNSSSKTTRAGATPETGPEADAAAEEIQGQLTDLGITGDVLKLALAEPDRAQAWLEVAAAEADTNPAGFVANGLREGTWPSQRDPGPTQLDPATRLEQFARFVHRIGFDYDHATLDLELDDRHITDPDDRQAMHDLAARIRSGEEEPELEAPAA